MSRALLGIPGWLAYTVLMVPCVVLGFLLVAIAPVRTREDADRVYRQHFTWAWMWLWDNAEDGVDGDPLQLYLPAKNPAWMEQTLHWSSWRRRWVWSAWRNSVGNARRTRVFGVTVDPARVRLHAGADVGYEDLLKEGPYVARQGWRYEVKRCWNPKQPDWRERRFCWVGWRLAQQTSITSNVGCAFQLGARL